MNVTETAHETPESGRLFGLIQEYLENSTQAAILLSESGGGFAYSDAEYVRKFTKLLPDFNESLLQSSTEQSRRSIPDLEVIREKLGLSHSKDGKPLQGIVIHRSIGLYSEQDHVIYSTPFPKVFFHALGDVYPGVSGDGGYFLTVNLDVAEIQNLAAQAGATIDNKPYRYFTGFLLT